MASAATYDPDDAGFSYGLYVAGVIASVALLYRTSRRFKFYLKYLVFYSIILSSATLMLFYAIWKPGEVDNHWPLTIAIPWCARHIFGLEVEVRNRHKAESNSPYIMMANHQSSIDVFVMMFPWPRRCTSLCKKELFYIWPFGISARLCGTIFIDRFNHERAMNTLAKTAAIIKERNVKVLVFPEGTRNHGTELMPFKKGCFHLAVQAQIPIVPMVFSSYQHFYNKQEMKFEGGKVVVTILDPVSTVGLTSSDVNQLADSVRNKMAEVYKQTSEELLNGASK